MAGLSPIAASLHHHNSRTTLLQLLQQLGACHRAALPPLQLASGSSSSSGCAAARPFSSTSSTPQQQSQQPPTQQQQQPPKQQQRSTSSWRRQELQAVRAYVFEQQIGDGRRSGWRSIMRPLKGRRIADWYFTLSGPKMPMVADELEEARQTRVELARATGSGPPKKGQGKRAKK